MQIHVVRCNGWVVIPISYDLLELLPSGEKRWLGQSHVSNFGDGRHPRWERFVDNVINFMVLNPK